MSSNSNPMINYVDKLNSVDLAFLSSNKVKVFPSGRRRSTVVDSDDSTNTVSDQYYIPFDPEARLTTEANSRKHSGLNGYTQTYLKEWDQGSDVEGNIKNGRILLSLGGYLFDIELSSLKTPAAFGDEFDTAVSGATKIYANIILEDVLLYSSSTTLKYYTSILRDQINAANSPSSCLDLLDTDEDKNSEYTSNLDHYYFSGLSFSATSLKASYSGSADGIKTLSRDTRTITQHVESLQILEKVGDTWQMYQPAFLPKIEHGTTADSIVIYGDALLKSSLSIEGATEIRNNTTIKNINVGAPTNPVNEDTGGYIVAQKNITTEQDLIAEQNLSVGSNASITGNLDVAANTTLKTSLVVGDRTPEDSTEAGDLIVKNHIETPTIEATESVTTSQATVKTELNVSNTDKNAIANIDNANITGELNVQNESSNAKITADTAEVTTDLTVYESITVGANPDPGTDYTINRYPQTSINGGTIVTSDIESKFSITTPRLTVASATITELNGYDNLQYTGTDAQNNPIFSKVPVIFLEKVDDEYQLKLSRVNKKGF